MIMLRSLLLCLLGIVVIIGCLYFKATSDAIWINLVALLGVAVAAVAGIQIYNRVSLHSRIRAKR